jgi:predicted LPLAT superfamily acyltransferase
MEAQGLQEVKAPTLLRQMANIWRQGSQPYVPAALYPQVSLFLKIPGTHFCQRLS